MKRSKGLKAAVGISAACICTAMVSGLGGAGFAAPPLASRAPIYKQGLEGIIRFTRIAVLGEKLGAHVWEIVGDTRIAYNSLYAPELRKRLGSQPKGTRVAEEVSPAAVIPAVGTRDPDQRERKDFEDFCQAHGLRFIVLLIT